MARSADKKRSGKRAAPKKAARPVLGNDPFERGAAPRPVAMPAAGPKPPGAGSAAPVATAGATPEPEPISSAASASAATPLPLTAGVGRAQQARSRGRPTPAELRRKLDQLESRISTALAGAEARIAALAGSGGSARYAQDLRELARKLLPLLRQRLRSASSLRSLFQLAGPLDPFGMDPLLGERAEPILDFLFRSWWRVETRFVERVPSEGAAVVVANHGGTLHWDALVLRIALAREHPTRRDLRPLLDDAALRVPLAGRAALRLGAVAATPENAARLLDEGKVVAVFPEGSRAGRKPWAERYHLQQFGRGGFARIALRAGAPIVPCAIVGSEEAAPAFARTGWFAERLGLELLAGAPGLPLGPAALVPLPSKWSIRFGDPIETRAHGPASADDRSLVNDVAERVRARVQAMLDEDVAGRKSVFL